MHFTENVAVALFIAALDSVAFWDIEPHLLVYDRRRSHGVLGVYTRLIAGHVHDTHKGLERFALAA